MNKDVIYIEPENDITDIIDKVKSAKQKIIAIVPPKKSTVLSSTVNIKLLSRAGKSASKKLVLVTTDPALMKLASTAEIPVAKNLQSRPEIPLLIKDNSSPEKDDGTVDDAEGEVLIKKAQKDLPEKPTESEAIEIIESEDEADEPAGNPDEPADTAGEADTDQKASKKAADAKSAKKKSLIPSLDRYRKWIILGAVGLVIVVGFIVWALVIAPAVKITVSIRTTGQNFSDSISFVTDPQKEIVSDGIFALETTELSKKVIADFAATGEINKGEKASGTVTVYYDFTATHSDPITVATGARYANGDLGYITSAATTISMPDDLEKGCGDDSPRLSCRVTADLKVTAENSGAKYNTTASTGWTPGTMSALAIVGSDISGGSDKVVKVVSQKDFDAAKSLLSSTSESTGRAELLEKFPSSTLPIDGSLKVSAKDPVSSPKVGEEVAEGITPQISAETVFSMYGVDRNKLSEFIKTRLAPTIPVGQKIYATGVSDDSEANKTRLENYKVDGENITAKLTSYGVQVGPSITEPEILEKSRGRKIGNVRTQLKPLLGSNGDVVIDKSFFWVSTVPDDPNKIEISITIEE